MSLGTTIADVEHAADKAFKTELNAFQNGEVEANRLSAAIEEYAHYLIQKDQDCDPWTLDHFDEAMNNASENDRMMTFIAIASAVDLGLKNDYANHMAMTAIRKLVSEYWLSCARFEATKHLGKR